MPIELPIVLPIGPRLQVSRLQASKIDSFYRQHSRSIGCQTVPQAAQLCGTPSFKKSSFGTLPGLKAAGLHAVESPSKLPAPQAASLQASRLQRIDSQASRMQASKIGSFYRGRTPVPQAATGCQTVCNFLSKNFPKSMKINENR